MAIGNGTYNSNMEGRMETSILVRSGTVTNFDPDVERIRRN